MLIRYVLVCSYFILVHVWYLPSWCCYLLVSFFFFKQKTAYEMRISDWSSDVCSSDLDHSASSSFSVIAIEPVPLQRGQLRQSRLMSGAANHPPAPPDRKSVV